MHTNHLKRIVYCNACVEVVFLKRWIGSSNGTSAKGIETCLKNKNYPTEQQGNYFLTDFPEEQVPSLARDLSTAVMEYLFPQMILTSLKNADPQLSPAELQMLAKKSLAQLQRDGILPPLRRKLTADIEQHLREFPLLSLEGLVFFRCRALFSSTEECLTQILQRHRTRKMLSTLREYVRQRKPRAEFLKISEQAEEYFIFDENGQRIIPTFSQQFTPEEELLNALLWFSPQKLDLSALKDTSLRSVLEEIFSDRIVFP